MSRRNHDHEDRSDQRTGRERGGGKNKNNANKLITAIVVIALVFTVFGGISFTSHEAEAASGWDGQPSPVYTSTQAFRTANATNPGSSANPYLIETAGDLKLLQNIINNNTEPSKYNTSSVYYKMTDDIILNDLSLVNVWSDGLSPKNKWTPISNTTNTFKANFDGDHFAVKGVYVNVTAGGAGLFGFVNGKIQNLGVEQSYIKGSSNIFQDGIGGIAGYLGSGSITNCYNTGTVAGTNYVGGIVGYSYGSITNCYNTGSVTGTVTGSTYVGGIAGHMGSSSIITNCYNTGTVAGTNYVGGIVGHIYGSITNCYNTGTVTGSNSVGGIVGYSSGGSITNCYNTGSVTDTVTGSNSVGGIVGYNNAGTVTYCYFLKVTGGINGNINNVIGNPASTPTTCGTFVANGNMTSPLTGTLQSTMNTNAVNNMLTGWTGTPFPYLNTLGPTKGYSAIWNGTVATGFAGGNGTAGNPYKISTASQLAYMRQQVNNNVSGYNTSSVYYVLTNDIYLNDTSNWKNWGTAAPARTWTPIGTYINSSSVGFAANFDGNGFAVKGVYVNITAGDAGLFGYVTTGEIQNLGVEQSYIKGSSMYGDGKGGIAGYLDGGSITNCYNTGTVTGSNSVGGIAGVLDAGRITNCYNTGTVTGSDFVGGIAGYSYDRITNCYNTGTVTGSGNYVGGIAGYNYDASITNCYNTGTVTGSSPVGGIAGYNDGGSITNCYNTGTVTGSSSVGGIAGYLDVGSSIKNCYCPSTMNFVGTITSGTTTDLLKFNTDGTFVSPGSVTVTGVGTATKVVDALNYWACSANITAGTDEYLYFESTGATSGLMFRLTESGVYKAKFDLNGLSGTAPADQVKKYGEKLTAPANPSVGPGATFVGWFTKNGTGGDWGVKWDFAKDVVQNGMTLYARSETTSLAVTYSANGGAGTAPTESNKIPGETFAAASASGLTAPAGKQFKQWNTLANGQGTAYAPGATVTMPSSALTLYAIWEDILYSVKYNANGGPGLFKIPIQSVAPGATFTARAADTFDPPTGMEFKEWNTKDDGTGTPYAAGATVTMPASNIILYAIWDYLKFAVTFDLNGGSGIAPNNLEVPAGTAFSIPYASGLTAPAGKQFKEWNTQADGSGYGYAENEDLKMPAADLTLYAIWEATYSVTYNANGGAGTAPAESNKTMDATFAAASASGLTAPSGKQFKEWNTSADGSGTGYAAGAAVTMPASALTLYAIWENVPGGDDTGGASGNDGGGGSSMILIAVIIAAIAAAGFAAYWFLLRKKP